MGLRVGVAVQPEFLRMVLRQLLRRIVGVEVVSVAATLADATAPATAWVVDRALATADPDGFARLCRIHPGRVVLLDDDTEGRSPAMHAPVARLPLGPKPDPAALAVLLRDVLAPWVAGSPCDRPVAALAMPPRTKDTVRVRRPELILVAASTGGPEALQELFAALRPPPCPVVIALHIPVEHCEGLARHLGAVTGHPVQVGAESRLPAQGIVLLKGGMDQGVVVRGDGLWLNRVRGGASVFHPNADILLSSAAGLGRAVVGVVLTGMGDDGRIGAAALAAQLYPVLAQSPGSCAVPGMPASCIASGSVYAVAPPRELAERLNVWFALVPGL